MLCCCRKLAQQTTHALDGQSLGQPCRRVDGRHLSSSAGGRAATSASAASARARLRCSSTCSPDSSASCEWCWSCVAKPRHHPSSISGPRRTQRQFASCGMWAGSCVSQGNPVHAGRKQQRHRECGAYLQRLRQLPHTEVEVLGLRLLRPCHFGLATDTASTDSKLRPSHEEADDTGPTETPKRQSGHRG